MTATLSVEENKEGSAPATLTRTPKRTMLRIVETMKAFDLRRTMISRSMTSPMEVVKPARFVVVRFSRLCAAGVVVVSVALMIA